jgi:hypothetical protein
MQVVRPRRDEVYFRDLNASILPFVASQSVVEKDLCLAGHHRHGGKPIQPSLCKELKAFKNHL